MNGGRCDDIRRQSSLGMSFSSARLCVREVECIFPRNGGNAIADRTFTGYAENDHEVRRTTREEREETSQK